MRKCHTCIVSSKRYLLHNVHVIALAVNFVPTIEPLVVEILADLGLVVDDHPQRHRGHRFHTAAAQHG